VENEYEAIDKGGKAILENYFMQLKFVIIFIYSLIFLFYLFKDAISQAPVILMTWTICILISSGYFFHYLWNSAILVGKRPLHYLGLSIIIPIFGPVMAYWLLKKAGAVSNAVAVGYQRKLSESNKKFWGTIWIIATIGFVAAIIIPQLPRQPEVRVATPVPVPTPAPAPAPVHGKDGIPRVGFDPRDAIPRVGFDPRDVSTVKTPAPAPALTPISPEQEHFDKIRRAHPDFEKYRDSGALKAWIQKQPSHLRDSLLKVYSKGDADSVIALFNQFKKDNNGPALKTPVPAPSHRGKESGRSVTYTPKNKIQTPLPKHEMEDNPRQEQDWKPREDAVKIPKADVSITRSPEKQSQTPMGNVKPSVDADQRYRRIKGIVLMDGNVIEGQIISMNTDIVKIRAKEGNILSYDFKKEVQRFITE
jgi:hypothetical protein